MYSHMPGVSKQCLAPVILRPVLSHLSWRSHLLPVIGDIGGAEAALPGSVFACEEEGNTVRAL